MKSPNSLPSRREFRFRSHLAEMGDWLPRVTVALEDRRFYRHQRNRFAGHLRRLSPEFESGSHHCGRINHHPATRQNCLPPAKAKLVRQTLRKYRRLEIGTRMDQGADSCRIFESEQLRQSPSWTGGCITCLLWKTRTRVDSRRIGLPRWFAAGANPIQSLATSGPSGAKICTFIGSLNENGSSDRGSSEHS